jgi:hypothetical protein
MSKGALQPQDRRLVQTNHLSLLLLRLRPGLTELSTRKPDEFARQKPDPNVALVRVRDAQRAFSTHHELVFPTRKWSLKTEPLQGLEEFTTADRAKRGHLSPPCAREGRCR